MEHRTTIIEIKIEPTDFFRITQGWAQNSKFAFYEKRGSRTIYRKRIRHMQAWLSVEHNNEKGKLEAWMSPRGVDPDFVGSAWKGWKLAVPEGFGVGPQFIYKKQFEGLLRLLTEKSTDVVSRETGKQVNQQKLNIDKSMVTKGLAVFGIIYFLSGAVSLFTAASLIIHRSFLSLASTLSAEGVLHLIIGTLLFSSSKAITKGKIVGIWLYVGGVLLYSMYSIVTGFNLNYMFIGFALLLIWQMFKWKEAWNLS